MDNAKKMNADIENADFCVLSHGHYDHSGGFAKYLEENGDKKIYAMNTAIEEYYSGSGNNIHEIGIPSNVYPAHEDKFIFIDKATEISKGIYLIPHSTAGLEKIGERAKLYKKTDGRYIPDNFCHEMSLVLETDKGLIVFNSCSHSGIVNIMDEVKNYFKNRSVYVFFGGLHMKGKENGTEICTFSENEIQKIAEYLKNIGLNKLYTGHCTGLVGFEMIKKYMGEAAEYLMTGKEIYM